MIQTENFQEPYKYVYDNLSKEKFDWLLDSSAAMIRDLITSGKARGTPPDIIFEDRLHTLAFNVWCTVYESRKLSFKQFKVLSAFSKVKWMENDTEYKQF